MKESVEQQKDEVRNMTMILNSPEFLNMSVMKAEMQGTHQVGGMNILDELNEEENPNSQGVTHMNNITVGGDRNGTNASVMNVSSNRGLNTTMNFIKSTVVVIKCKGRLSNSSSNRKWGNPSSRAKGNTIAPS